MSLFVTSDNQVWAIKKKKVYLCYPNFHYKFTTTLMRRKVSNTQGPMLEGTQKDPPFKPRSGHCCSSSSFCFSSDDSKSRLRCSEFFLVWNFKFFQKLTIFRAQLFTRVIRRLKRCSDWKWGPLPLSVSGQSVQHILFVFVYCLKKLFSNYLKIEKSKNYLH